ncbi:MAG: hypothetical protein ACYTEQ_01080 [Planctomycetota bacterium]|jgi:hypothetical protein
MNETKERDLVPLPGWALIGMNMQYGDREGQIRIPESAWSRTPLGRVGYVASITPYPEGVASLVYEHGELVPRPAWRDNERYIALLDKYVICRKAKWLTGNLHRCRLEFIDSVVPERCRPKASELGRCVRCQTKGEANMLLGADGYCPVCGMNAAGAHKEDDLMDVDDAVVDQIRKAVELDHFQRNGGLRLFDKTVSVPGQKLPDFRQPKVDPNQTNEIIRGWIENGDMI